MDHWQKFVKVLILCMVVAHCGFGEETAFFVSFQGSDAHPGTKTQPLKTLEAAREAVRKAGRAEKVVVWLRAGVYAREKSFRLSSEDSGRPGKPVIYRAWPGEEVRIVGGKRIEDWKRVRDQAVLNRLLPEARSKVFQADLKAAGLTDFGQVKGGGLELFFNDKPMTLARWPNEGFVKITGLVEPGTVNVRGTKGRSAGARRTIRGSTAIGSGIGPTSGRRSNRSTPTSASSPLCHPTTITGTVSASGSTG